MLGSKFRKLRKARGTSIKQTAEGITSASRLQRWEDGKGEMPIDKVLMLLDKLHLQSDELIDNSDNLKIYTVLVEEAVKNNDVNSLRKTAKELLNFHNANPQNKRLFFQTAIACNFLVDATNEQLMSQQDLLRLKLYFSSVEKWSQENALLFANTQYLLSDQTIYLVSRSLYSELVDLKPEGAFYYLALNALINAMFVLLKKQSFEKGKFILDQLSKLDLPDRYSDEKIRINYAVTVFSYLKTGSTAEMDEFLNGLKSIGLENKVAEFELGFKQFQELNKSAKQG